MKGDSSTILDGLRGWLEKIISNSERCSSRSVGGQMRCNCGGWKSISARLLVPKRTDIAATTARHSTFTANP